MLFDHVYLLVTCNRRRLSVIVDVHYVSAIFKLYLIVTLFSCFGCLSLLSFSVLIEVLSKLHAIKYLNLLKFIY